MPLDFFIKFYNLINPIQIVVLFTFILSVFKINLNSKIQYYYFLIVSLSLLFEIICNILIILNLDINIIYNISFISINSLWILIINQFFNTKYVNKVVLPYIMFGICNLIFFEKSDLNYLTFIFGSILYIILFIIEIRKKLQDDIFLEKNKQKFALVCAPIFLFLGLSLVFSFRSTKIIYSNLFYDIYLYDFVIYVSNFLFYMSIVHYLLSKRRRYE